MEQHGYRILDLETYYRKDIYRRFTQVARSSVSITHRIDVTDLVEHSHRSGTKFYINFLYLLANRFGPDAMYWSYGIGWAVACALSVYHYAAGKWRGKYRSE